MNTKKHLRYLVASFILMSSISCSVTQKQKKGNVSPEKFHHKTTFTTTKSIITLPVLINGESKNFLFDTGAQLNLIQREQLLGNSSKYIGASKRKVALGNEIVSSLKIGAVDFKNTYSLNGDLIGLKEQIENFGGIIGQSIIRKANWLIDYPKKQIEFSNETLITDNDNYKRIKIIRDGGSPYTYITINEKQYKVVIDLGSSSPGLNIPKDMPLAKEILSKYEFKNNERNIYTLGGTQTVKEKVGTIPKIMLGTIEFKNVETDIRNSSQLRLGIQFFKDYSIYIDNTNGDYKIKKQTP